MAAGRKPGRPPLAWLTPDQLAGLPAGTAVWIDRSNGHGYKGRILMAVGDQLELADGRLVDLTRITRARVLDGLFESGDLVVRRGVDEADWRGGVVRCDGLMVFVESTGGDGWVPEDELERPEDRATGDLAATA